MFTTRLLNFLFTWGNESIYGLIKGINSPVPVISSPSTDSQQSDIEINLKNNLWCSSLPSLLTNNITYNQNHGPQLISYISLPPPVRCLGNAQLWAHQENSWGHSLDASWSFLARDWCLWTSCTNQLPIRWASPTHCSSQIWNPWEHCSTLREVLSLVGAMQGWAVPHTSIRTNSYLSEDFEGFCQSLAHSPHSFCLQFIHQLLEVLEKKGKIKQEWVASRVFLLTRAGKKPRKGCAHPAQAALRFSVSGLWTTDNPYKIMEGAKPLEIRLTLFCSFR